MYRGSNAGVASRRGKPRSEATRILRGKPRSEATRILRGKPRSEATRILRGKLVGGVAPA